MQWWHWALGIGLALASFAFAVFTGGWGFAIASTLLGGAIGAGYGAATAYYLHQDVTTGALLGMITGIIMGNTAFAGSKIFLGKSILGAASVTTRIFGTLVAFVGGGIAGGYNEGCSQIRNYGKINDKSAIIAAIFEYGCVNVFSMLTGVITDEVEGLQQILWGIYFFNVLACTITLAIDALRNP